MCYLTDGQAQIMYNNYTNYPKPSGFLMAEISFS